MERCGWVGLEQIYVDYHDADWGVPEYDSRALWEKLVLDGFQAGLSWLTILKKSEIFAQSLQGSTPMSSRLGVKMTLNAFCKTPELFVIVVRLKLPLAMRGSGKRLSNVKDLIRFCGIMWVGHLSKIIGRPKQMFLPLPNCRLKFRRI